MNNSSISCFGSDVSYKATLTTIKISITIKAKKTGRLPYYSGSIFRGMLGSEIRKLSCVNKGETCEKCPFIKNCAYSFLFEPLSSVFFPELQSFQPILTPPYIIEAPTFLDCIWEEGEGKVVNVILLGKGTRYIHYFLESFFTIGNLGIGKNRIPFEVCQIEQSFQDQTNRLLSNNGQINYDQMKVENRIWSTEMDHTNSILVLLETPLRLQRLGKYVNNLTEDDFLTNCYRRLEYMAKVHQQSFHYSDEVFALLKSGLRMTQNQTVWTDWHRYSGRQKETMNLGGLTGVFSLEGETLPHLLPLLRFCEFVHIGKQSSFGLGKFSLWKKV